MTFDNEKHAQWLIGQVQKGKMSRREFLGRAGALGIAATLGTTMIDSAHAEGPKKGGHDHGIGWLPVHYEVHGEKDRSHGRNTGGQAVHVIQQVDGIGDADQPKDR